MDDENKVDVLKTISQVHRSQFDERRHYEWQVLLLTLGVYAAILAGKYTNQITLSSSILFPWIFWFLSFLLALISSIYLFNIHRAHAINKRFAQIAEDALMDISGVQGFREFKNELEKGSKKGSNKGLKKVRGFFKNNWSIIWQVVTIILFGIATACIVLYL